MSKQVGLSAAIGLVGVGIILNALPKFGIGAATATAAPVSSAVQAGNPPTIVWYHMDGPQYNLQTLSRAWSDGTVELKFLLFNSNPNNPWCGAFLNCSTAWITVSSPNDGRAAVADTNFDQLVDGADLANLLAAWGPAPRSPIPPSDCPLDLINP